VVELAEVISCSSSRMAAATGIATSAPTIPSSTPPDAPMSQQRTIAAASLRRTR
jgi:hypothetical protein